MADRAARAWPVPTAPAIHRGVTLALAADVARWSLRTRSTDAPANAMLTAAPYRDGHALRLGPDEWLLILPTEVEPEPLEQPHALIDISDRMIGFVVEGAAAGALLQTGIALDLAEAAFPIGKATRTLFETVEIVLWRQGPARFHVEVARSFAPWLWAALDLAAGDLP